MAVKTPFSADHLTSIVSGYDLGVFVGSRGFDCGADQTNIQIATSSGRYAFRYYEKRPEEHVRFEIDLLHFLARRSYPSPAPIPWRDGSYLGTYDGKPYALFTLMPGGHSDTNDNYRQVAEVLARLHKLTSGYKPAYAGARTPYGAAYAWSCAQANANNVAPPSRAQERLRWFRDELDTLQLPDGLPTGVCHCDPNPSNFLYQDGRLSAVLDFDQASHTWLLYDVAQMIYWWTWPAKGDLDLVKTWDLVASYARERRLVDEEKRHLFDVLKLVHLVGIGWSLGDDSFPNDQRKVVTLDALGRDRFCDALFAQ